MDGKWVPEKEIAALLGVHVQTLRNWRWMDKKDGRRRGGLVYRIFEGTVRYWLSPDLVSGEQVKPHSGSRRIVFTPTDFRIPKPGDFVADSVGGFMKIAGSDHTKEKTIYTRTEEEQ